MDLEFFLAGLVLDWVFWGKGVFLGILGGFLLLCFWFCSEFYFFQGGTDIFHWIQCALFLRHFLRAVLFRYKSSVYSLRIHTCKFY